MSLDPVAALLLDESGIDAGEAAGPILVMDDPALANHLHSSGLQVRAWCDDLRDERELAVPRLDLLDESTAVKMGDDPQTPATNPTFLPHITAGSAALSEALAGVELVLLRLPKSLGMLQDYAERIAAWASPGVRVLAGGREKHLTRGMNEVLGESFGSVWASLGRRKSRVLHASLPTRGRRTWPRESRLDEVGLTVVSHGGVFAAGRLDGGTRLLLHALQVGAPDEARRRTADLGCGSGILACSLAREGHQTLAVDVSRAAVDSARDTAERNRLDIDVRRTDGLADEPAHSIDLVVCNPPFHRGTTKDSSPGFTLLAGAVPALAPGAEVWTVFNSHLPYLPFLREVIGPTSVAARDRHYTVARSRREPGGRRAVPVG